MRYLNRIILIFLFVTLFSYLVVGEITQTDPSKYGTLLQGKNQVFDVDYSYSDASVFWFLNGNLISENNDLNSFFLNTTEYLTDNPEINFDDNDVDLILDVNIIDNSNPFSSQNFTWEYFVEPLNFKLEIDKDKYYTGQTILLEFDVVKGTKLDISIYDDNEDLFLKYPTVTIDDIKEFLIDSPDIIGNYQIRVDSSFYEYSKSLVKNFEVEENTNIDLTNNFIKISMFPESPSVNDTVVFEAVMNDYSDLVFEWDFDLDGDYDKFGKEVEISFDDQKSYILELRIENTKTGEEIIKHKSFKISDEKSLVKFQLRDFFTKNVIRNANVIIDSVEYVSDIKGDVNFFIDNGEYEFRILHPDYNEYKQSLSLNGNYLQTIYLYKTNEFEKAIDGDKIKPEITLISPKPGEIKSDLFIDFEYNASDNIYLSDCTLFLKPKNAVDWTKKIRRDNLGSFTNQKIKQDLSYDTYLYKIICSDKNSNQFSSDVVEFSVSKYATTTMYRDDLREIESFIQVIDDAITNPKGFSNTEIEIYDLYDVEKKLVDLATDARKIKTDFYEILMGKDTPDKVNNKINEINSFMQEQKQQNIKFIEIIDSRQFLRSYTKDKIKKVIDDLYGSIFDSETLEKLSDNIFLKQKNLDITTKIVKVELRFLDDSRKIENIVINDIKQKNLNTGSIVYQIIPESITTNIDFLRINSKYGEITKTNKNNLVISIFPFDTLGKSYYYIDDDFDFSLINSLDTILIDNADKTENIKKIVVSGKNEMTEELNILNNIDVSSQKSKPDSKTGLENIQGKVITDSPSEYEYETSFEDVLPYIFLSIILGIMMLSGVMVFSSNGSSKNDDVDLDSYIDELEDQINSLQIKISKKIENLIKDEDNFINELTVSVPDEKEIIQKNVSEIEDKIKAHKEELSTLKVEDNKNISEITTPKTENPVNKKKPNLHEFFVDEDDDFTKDKILDFNSKIDDLKKEIL